MILFSFLLLGISCGGQKKQNQESDSNIPAPNGLLGTLSLRISPEKVAYSSSDQMVQFELIDLSQFEVKEILCKINDQIYQSCQDKKIDLQKMNEGLSTIQIRVIYANGLYEEAMSKIKIDRVNPILKIVKTPGTMTKERFAEFNFSASDDGSGIESLQCFLDGKEILPCTSQYVSEGLNDGAHEFKFIVKDFAKNISEFSHHWTVDTEGPQINWTRIVPEIVLNRTSYKHLRVNFEIKDLFTQDLKVKCQLNLEPEFDCSSGKVSLNNLNVGMQKLVLKAQDPLGNVSEKFIDWEIYNEELVAGYTGLSKTELQTLREFPQLSLTDGEPSYLKSACGIFRNTGIVNIANPSQFWDVRNFSMHSNLVGTQILTVAESVNSILVGTNQGLYKSSNGAQSFNSIFNLSDANQILAQQVPRFNPCLNQQLPPGNGFPLSKVLFKGSFVATQVNNTPLGLFFSNDGGNTFWAPQFWEGKNQLVPPNFVNSLQLTDSGDILLATEYILDATGSITALPLGAATCSRIKPQGKLGIWISKDFGKTFYPQNSISHRYLSAFIWRELGQSTDSILMYGSQLWNSQNGGQTINGSNVFADPNYNFKINNNILSKDYLTEGNRFSMTGQSLWFIAQNISGETLDLMSSQDKGFNWRLESPDSRFNKGNINFSAAKKMEKGVLAVASDHGIYVNDFTKESFNRFDYFDTNFCQYPWWRVKTGGVFSSEQDIFRWGGINSVSLISRDQGRTFKKWSSVPANAVKVFEGKNQEIVVYNNLFNSSLDRGNSFQTGTNSYFDNQRGLSYYGIINRLSNAIYISNDVNNFSNFINSYFLSLRTSLLGAVSFRNRILAFTSRSIFIFNSSVLSQQLNLPQGFSFYGWEFLDNKIFVLGDKNYVSTDQGSSFQLLVLPGGIKNIWKVGNRFYASGGNQSLLFQSEDGLSWKEGEHQIKSIELL